MKPSELRHLLAASGLRLTKALGQNFLHDANQLRRIVAAAELRGGDRVLEIGPGLGPLTERLLGAAGEVLAIEKDTRVAALLEARLGSHPKLRLIRADALEYLRTIATDWTDWKLVANLPYSIASPLLVELAQGPSRPELIVATVQLEVARRLMAGADTADYGVLTLLIQLRYAPLGWFKIPAACFFPVPGVDSACVTLRRRSVPLLPVGLEQQFTTIVKRSFGQRRKMLGKLLRGTWPAEQVAAAFTRLGLPEQARAETLSLTQFVGLTGLLLPTRPEPPSLPRL